MLRMNNFRTLTWLILCLATLLITGCANFQAQRAYDAAEQLVAEENFDLAVGKYYEATQKRPDSKSYKLKLLSTRTRAAAFHVKKARDLASKDQLEAALTEYRLARGFDPSLGVAAQEEQALLSKLEATKLVEEAGNYYRQRRLSQVQKLLNQALELDPQNVAALALKKTIAEDRHLIAMDGIDLDVASDEPITLRFKDANIKEVFGILNQLTGINFIMDEDIRDQSISVLLEKASFAQAMQLILQMNGLGKKVLNSKTIIIFPQTKEKEKQYEDQIIQTFYLSHIDAKKAVNLLRTMLQLRKIYVHEERNALVIRDTPDVIRLAEQVLDAADRENSEVLFHLEIIAVQNTDDLKIGPRLNEYSVSAGFAKQGSDTIVSSIIPDAGETTNLIKSLNNLQTFYTLPAGAFDLAKTLTDTEVLASPKIRVRNKEKAKVHIGTREPVITVTTTGDTSTDNIQYVDVGVKVDVEPTIQLDNTVETKLTLEVSQVIDQLETTNGSVALTISTTNASSVLTLKDGVQTIIGGLFEQQASKTSKTVPILGDIPLLGKLFSNIVNQDTKREILLSITPYIVKQVAVPGLDVATIWSGGEDNLKNGPNFGAFAEPLVSEVEATRPQAAPALATKAPAQPEAASAPALGVSVEPPAGETAEIPPAQPTEVLTEMQPVQPTEESTSPVVAPFEGIPPEPGVITPPVEAAPPVVSEPQPELPVVTPPEGPAEVTEPVPPVATEPMVMPESTLTEAPTVLEIPARGPAQLALSGPPLVDEGAEFTFTVEVKDIEQLYSAPLFVSYDPTLLDIVTVSEGAFLKQAGQSTVFSSSPNRATGQVIVGYKQGAGGKGVSGSGVLFTLTFRPKAVGTTEVALTRINFRNPEGTRLEVSPATAVVEIR